MPDSSQIPRSAAQFPPANREAWEKLALKTASISDLDELVTTTADAVRIEPLYSADDAPDPAPVLAVQGSAPAIRSLVTAPTPEAANTAIKAEVAGGAHEILLQFEAPGQAGIRLGNADDLARILDGIEPGSIALHLRNDITSDDAAAPGPTLRRLSSFWNQGVSDERPTCGFGIDTISSAATGQIDFSRLTDNNLAWEAGMVGFALENAPGALVLRASGLACHEAGGTQAQELAAMLAAATAYLRAGEACQIPPRDMAPRIEIEMVADAELLLSIAKLRAVRLLWARLGEECGFEAPAQLSVQTSARMMCVSDPQTNMVRTSIAALGAGIGGADALTILPFSHAVGQPDAFARRIARNTSHILSDEARIGEVADASAGSWALDSLTMALCEAAWTNFTQIEGEGGIVQSLISGSLQSRVAAARDQLMADIAQGRRVLVGASAFKPESVPAFKSKPWSVPPQIDGPMPTLRPIRLEADS